MYKCPYCETEYSDIQVDRLPSKRCVHCGGNVQSIVEEIEEYELDDNSYFFDGGNTFRPLMPDYR